MVSSKVEPIIITAFYDMKGQYSLPSDGTRQRLANLLDVIEERFNIHCIETFNRMESKIIHLIDSNEVNMFLSEVINFDSSCTYLYIYHHEILFNMKS